MIGDGHACLDWNRIDNSNPIVFGTFMINKEWYIF